MEWTDSSAVSMAKLLHLLQDSVGNKKREFTFQKPLQAYNQGIGGVDLLHKMTGCYRLHYRCRSDTSPYTHAA